MVDPYKILDVDVDATPDEIKRAWRKLASMWHPDRCPDDPLAGERFKLAREAYELLIDATRRAEFDDTGDSRRPRNLTSDALNWIAGGVYSLLAKDGGANLVEDLRANATVRQCEIRDTLQVIDKNIRTLQKCKKRIAFKGRGENFITDLVDGQIRETRDGRVKAERQLEIMQCAVEILEDYEDIIEAGEFQTITWQTIRMSSATTSTD